MFPDIFKDRNTIVLVVDDSKLQRMQLNDFLTQEGYTVIEAENGYVLKLIRPQTFTMGSSRREQGRRSNETLRKIKLLRPFYMGTKEVTNKEFKAFLASHDSGSFKQKSL